SCSPSCAGCGEAPAERSPGRPLSASPPSSSPRPKRPGRNSPAAPPRPARPPTRKETRALPVFEIAAAQPRLLRAVAGVARLPDLERFLRDERVRIVVADGRNALLRSEKRYDLIQVDALYRTSAMSGNLYSVEFFRLCASRLKPGGIVCSQAPSRRAALTFAAALPY